MKSLGIISEFNPFHNGHKFLLEQAKIQLNTDLHISFMSGDFIQRGDASVMDKYLRAYVAIKSGFDLVVEMPSFVSLQAAEFFALKSIVILNKMNIDYLVFGIENISPDDFLQGASKIIENQNSIDGKIKSLLKEGLSYPKAYNIMIDELVGCDFVSSNNILALEYLRAINKLNSKIKPYPIKRIKTSNKDKLIYDECFASSTAIRNNLDSEIYKLMPAISFEKLIDFRNTYQDFDEDYIYKIFRYKILIEKFPMTTILGFEEGIDNYLYRLARRNLSYKSFLDEATSLRYTRSRIKRIILNYILANTENLNDIDISFIKILAYNENASQIFKKLSENLKIVINKKDISKLDSNNLLIHKKMIEASNLYSLGINRDIDYDFVHNNRPIDW